MSQFVMISGCSGSSKSMLEMGDEMVGDSEKLTASAAKAFAVVGA
jgi:hypothetical protein